jgi:Phasin protein
MRNGWAGSIRAEGETVCLSEYDAVGSSVASGHVAGPAFGTLPCTACCLCTNDLCGRPKQPLECQMRKRKPATASKHARSPKIAAKAQRATQAIVRSPKHSHLRSVAAGSTELSLKRHNDAQQEAPLVENPATALQDACKETMPDNDSKKGFDFSPATANVRAYQAKLLEMAQANMQFAFEFAQRLATIRSPVEFLSVMAEFTSKRIAMFRQYSKEMAELSTTR